MKERCIKSAKACLLKNEYLVTCAINRENDNNHRKKAALERGLPETVTWNDITIYNCEQEKLKYIKEMRLSKSASWSDITKYSCNKARVDFALKKGLPENSTWSRINQ